MSHGFMVLNDDLEYLVIDEYLTPWLAGKCSITSYGSWYDGGGGYELRQVHYSAPGSGHRVLAATLPINSGDVWYGGSVALASGSAVLRFQARPTGGGASVEDQELYAFTTDAPPAPSTGWGLQVFNSVGALVFDSNSGPLAIKAIATHAVGSVNSALPTLPTKPAFILPGLGRHNYEGHPTLPVSTLTVMVGGVQRGSGLSSKFIDESTEGVDAYFDGTYTFGSTLAQAIPIINAAMYD